MSDPEMRDAIQMAYREGLADGLRLASDELQGLCVTELGMDDECSGPRTLVQTFRLIVRLARGGTTR